MRVPTPGQERTSNLGDGQPQPGAAGLAGPGLVGAVEAVEHVGQAAGVDALALVLDGEAGHAVPQGGGQGDVPSGGGVFDGVVH